MKFEELRIALYRGRRRARAAALDVLQPIRKRRSMTPDRLTGKLAINGGKPVWDKAVRSWPNYPEMSNRDWRQVQSVAKQLFKEGREGTPQELSKEFARQWADYIGVRHALLLPHGTDALRLALAAALEHDGVDYGGEVIVPNLSFIASATAALDRRLSVALVDVDPDTLLIDPESVEEAIVPGRTRAIMVVHLFGQPADMSALREIAERHELKIIEDAAQAHGAIHELGRAGSIGDAGAFSFQSSKNLTAGEGGALTTNDPTLFERAYRLHDVGRAPVRGQRWAHETLGWNVRPSEYVAAVLLHRLKSLEREQVVRAERYEALRRALDGISCVDMIETGPGVVRHGVHMGVARYNSDACGGLSIDDFQRAIHAEGIPLAPLYNGITVSEQPAIKDLAHRHPDYVRVLSTPVADKAVREILFIPQNAFLGSEEDVLDIAHAFAKVERHFAGSTSVGADPRLDIQQLQGNGQEKTIRTDKRRVSPTASEKLRVAVVGLGVMGRHHAEAIQAHPSLTLAAVCDQVEQNAAKVSNRYGCRSYDSVASLIENGAIDAVVVATPHLNHLEVARPALENGLHVICEKPLSASVADADELVEVASRSPGKFAVVFQNRFEPAFSRAKKVLDSGSLGPITRCLIEESTWRTKDYYRDSAWRGTWAGEGGGVLVNQAPHVLDRYVWLCGLPESVMALCDTNLHEIEVEDTASAVLRHQTGAHGFIHVNTTEIPSISRTEIVCDRGRIVVEDGRLVVTTLKQSIREGTKTRSASDGLIDGETRELQLSRIGSIPGLLRRFYDDFADAIASDKELTCPGTDGLYAVELANAIQLSSSRRAEVSLPLDRSAYNSWFEEKLARV